MPKGSNKKQSMHCSLLHLGKHNVAFKQHYGKFLKKKLSDRNKNSFLKKISSQKFWTYSNNFFLELFEYVSKIITNTF